MRYFLVQNQLSRLVKSVSYTHLDVYKRQDLIKIAMINIHKDMKDQKLESKMTMQVHDELVFDVLKTEVEQMKAIITHRMKTAIKTEVPIEIEIGEGVNWLAAH